MKNNKDRIICVSEAVPTKMKVRGKNKYKDASYFWIFLCGSTAVPEERIPPIQRQETAVPEQRYRT